MPNTLVTTYLEMTDPADFHPAPLGAVAGQVVIMEACNPDVRFYKFLYNSVGDALLWRDRLLISDEALRAEIHAETTCIYVLYVDGTPAGYIELAQQGEETEVAYFGLRPGFKGRGLGKYLLSYGIARAWETGTKRIWLHTCNLDGKHALSNYLKRGFSVYAVEEEPMPQRYAS
ncbi:MAG: GNAT family N-acetyltransferase [Chloroflexi bacterium]|nr:GNAT family N-acetyltransferase [Chloroflexota bacterium]